MKIYVFTNIKILTFSLPPKVLGTFNFDENSEEEDKLINIEAENGKWYLYSTNSVTIISDNNAIDKVMLDIDKFYTVKRNDTVYLVYVTNIFDNSFVTYNYNEKLNLLVGSKDNCNVNYQLPYVKDEVIQIFKQNNSNYLNIGNSTVYLNNKRLTNNNNYLISASDEINFYGLRIIFYNGFVLINNLLFRVNVSLDDSGLSKAELNYGEQPQDFEIKDVPLYTKDMYFSKSPRIRRIIKTKEITLSPPPKKEGENQLPLILTVGPMLTMGIASGVMFANTISKIAVGTASIQSSWPSLITSGSMMISTLLWPTLTRHFNTNLKKKKKEELITKYTEYLKTKREELEAEVNLQKSILIENLIPVDECLNRIKSGRLGFWDKRMEQNDFLVVRLGHGNELLDVKINYPEEGFTIEENELRKQADELVEEYKYIPNVPIGYSLYTNRITAFMGDKNKCYGMLNNIILQLITFYSYDNLKLVIFTNEDNVKHWEYVRYLNHCFSNNRSVRFFSTTPDSHKNLTDYLNIEFQNRLQMAKEEAHSYKPYYVIITDDYTQIKGYSFIENLPEIDLNLGYSLIIMEEQMSKLPSKCNNYINLSTSSSTESDILKNSFEDQEHTTFHDEVNYNINMMNVVAKLSNIPIEFAEGNKELPEVLSFLEMEKVGKVDQLNIMNRWDSNDSTVSLKAEVGVDEAGKLMFLDIHEKYHGPHGLIAGMTGSGKSEFIITYILSMAINYSPDDVAFILIDYKGGGLAGAFENKVTGVTLPHLAGTITNLDKAEMDRTLVSIDSEIKRRQKIFNEARDNLGESTIDIYKYQRFYKEGKLTEPVPHLLIICDEFAELKSQQPDFMNNLISVARIGRSLGVHLILATQKPSGVVNDQIWSNTKFRVCLKVQDASDSKEMLKRPEAASLKQTGRFYLQVGYDEYFALGQSAWCGAKYYPSDKIVKQVDKSINFINDIGGVIKSIQADNNIRLESAGEQLSNIMNSIIEVAKVAGKKAKRLWLNDIDPIILVDNLEKKYNFTVTPYDIKAIIGEYDAPENQEQGPVIYSLRENGNTVIFGNEEVERENLLNALIYSICKNHSASEVNIYAIDYGSEQLRMFSEFPQIGGLVYAEDDESFKNLFKMITEEIKRRKNLLIPYGSSLISYNNSNQEKLPQIIFIINNYEGIIDTYNSIYEDVAIIGRDCERYGITMILTCNIPSTLSRRVGQCFNNRYAMHLADSQDYYGIFDVRVKIKPRNTSGRGLISNNGVHEFQTASIVPENVSTNEYIINVGKKLKESSPVVAKKIPKLPDKVTLDYVEKEITTLSKVPIGIAKDSLKVVKYDFSIFMTTSIVANKLDYLNSFLDSLLEVLLRIDNLNIVFLDPLHTQNAVANKTFKNRKINYYGQDLENVLTSFNTYMQDSNNKNVPMLYIIYSLEKLKQKVDTKVIEEFFKNMKANENSHVIICDSTKGLKSLDLETWYSKIKNNTDGIWVGKGFGDQQSFRLSKITKEMTSMTLNNYGFYVNESSATLIKLIEFNDLLVEGDEDNE